MPEGPTRLILTSADVERVSPELTAKQPHGHGHTLAGSARCSDHQANSVISPRRILHDAFDACLTTLNFLL